MFNSGGKFAKVPRTFMTIATLFLVTLPVQALFLAFINGVGWTKFSFLFIVMFVVVYCAAVCSPRSCLLLSRSLNENYLGPYFAHCSQIFDRIPLATESRSGRICHGNTNLYRRFIGTAYARVVFQDRTCTRCQR